jgi:hypothetical protein
VSESKNVGCEEKTELCDESESELCCMKGKNCRRESGEKIESEKIFMRACEKKILFLMYPTSIFHGIHDAFKGIYQFIKWDNS